MIEFFFDCSSPWTHLAFHNIQPMAKDLGVPITWRPILVGGIFNTVNPSVYAARAGGTPPLKARYSGKDMQDWARLAGLKIKMPPSVFPVNSVKVMRALLVVEPDKLVPVATEAFEAYWGRDIDISRDEAVADILTAAGCDPRAVMQRISDPDVKEQLRANTEEVMARGGFGSPTIFVGGDDMYFGNDRLPLVRYAIERKLAGAKTA